MGKLPLLLLGLAAWAHARLERSEPRDGSAVERAERIDLWFDSRIEPRFHHLSLRSASSERPLDSKADPGDPRHLSAPLPALSPGEWTVRYQVVSRDGHRVEGEVRFVVTGGVQP